jgi:DNA-binding NtrC family response regulator
MSLSQTAVESFLRQGRFQDIVADWQPGGSGLGTIPAEHRLAVAEALLRTGRIQAARTITTGVSEKGAPEHIRARCEMILGVAARELGFADEAIRRLHAAAKRAKDCGNVAYAAWSSLSAFRICSERQPKEIVSSALQDVRTLVTRAGDAHLSALLHESVARYEAQVGNLDEARRHLRVATELLTTYPNAWLEELVAINQFCIEFSECNLTRADEQLRLASSLERTTGALAQILANNTGHLQLHRGRFVEAERTLQETADRNVGEVRQSTLDGLARLYLAWGRLDDCERALNTLSEVEKSAELVPSFPFRSSLLTRTRLQLRVGNWHEAAKTAATAIAESEAVADGNVLAVALFLRGTALARLGRAQDAANSITRATMSGAFGIREHQGLLLRMSAEIALEREPRLASRWFTRAEAIWRIHGNVSAEAEFKNFRTVVENAGIETPRKSQAMVEGSSLVNSLASLFDISYSSSLLAQELKSIIEEQHLSSDVRIVDGEKQSTRRNEENSCALDINTQSRLTLVCAVPDDPLKAILLGDVMRIGRAALALERAREEERNRAALWPADPIEDQGDAIFLAEEMQSLLQTVRRIAPTTVPVLITGETGTGKEVLARIIHACSTRAKNVFLPFNCASTPKDMLDSQLFGHRRGAFTGAVEHFQGVIRAAAGGTLFLDEIGDTSLDVQPKLLRFLDSSEVHAIGEARPAKVDVRVIVATNADLDQLVADGRFREDLFYRLSIVRLPIPPLRERRVEIPSLANHYLRKHAQEYGKGDLRLSEDTMEYLVLYKWPGNVRQLASEMRRLAALAESDAVLMPEHLSREIAASRRTIPASERTLDPTEVVVRLDQPMAAATQHLERAMLQYALKKCDGRIEDTATMLGISRKGLYLKRQRFGIDPPGEPEASLA